jgi:hypothetical protein
MQFELDPEKPMIPLSQCYEGMHQAIDEAKRSLDGLLDICQGDIVYASTESPEFVDIKPELEKLYVDTVKAQCALDRLSLDFTEPYVKDTSFL